MYEGMLGAGEVSLFCVATESKPQTHKQMFKVADLAQVSEASSKPLLFVSVTQRYIRHTF